MHARFRQSREIQDAFVQANAEGIVQAIDAIVRAYGRQCKVLVCGNGGSAADAQHLAAEFVGRFNLDRASLGAIALTTDTSLLTAVGNDYGFEQIFSRQIEALGNEGDVLIAISTSGNSSNIVAAAKVAHAKGLFVIGLTGRGGGRLTTHCDLVLDAGAHSTARIQESHLIAEHVICDLVEDRLFGTGLAGVVRPPRSAGGKPKHDK
ncbi:MAG: SIS domain-containing protein [Myxococcales bacterium]|nr:SIS domain-containing protein [Myxococcales bacterium]